MADNVTITAGTGTTIASEDVAGVQHQKVKVEFGGDGVATMVSSSDPLPITGTVTANAGTDLNTSALALETGGNLASIKTNTDKIPALGQALASASVPVILPSATITTLTPPAAITNFANETGGNLAAIKAKTDNIPAQGQALAAASLPVVLTAAQMTTLTPPAAITGFATETTLALIKNTDGIKKITDALPTGTNSIGKISDITTSITPGTAAANLGKAEDAGHTSGDVGVMMLGVRNEGHDDFSGTDKDYVPIATDATGDVYTRVRHPLPAGTALIGKVGIDQTTANANEVVTKTGSVTAATLSAETTKVIGTINISASQTVGLVAGSAAIGKLAANSGVDIGDVDVTSLPALTAGTNAIGKLLPPDIDITAHTNYARKYYTNAGAVTDGIVWSPAAGKRWHVTSLYFQLSADATVTFEDDKAGGDDPVLKGEYKAGSGVALSFDEKYPMASGEDAADLIVTTTAGNICVTVIGYEI